MKEKQQVALVTGATKGIGRAIVEELLKEGLAVFLCARNEELLQKTLEDLSKSGKVSGKSCDLRDETEVETMFAECLKEFGGIDVLVNNAGIGIFGKTVEETSGEDFRSVLETNLFGVFYTCQRAVPIMRKRGGGYIFNISSLAGQNAHPRMATYNASKFGLNGFTEALMQEVRQDNIKVSLICPGSVNTEFGGEEITSAKNWQLHPQDIAQTVVDLLKHHPRSLPSKVEIRPSKPLKK